MSTEIGVEIQVKVHFVPGKTFGKEKVIPGAQKITTTDHGVWIRGEQDAVLFYAPHDVVAYVEQNEVKGN